jgi:hypothetical protein
MSKLLKSAMLAAGLTACAAVPSASAGGWYDGYYGGGGYYRVGYGGCCGVGFGYTSCCYERTVRYRRVYADPYGGGYYGGHYPRHVYYDPYPYIARYGGYYAGGGYYAVGVYGWGPRRYYYGGW